MNGIAIQRDIYYKGDIYGLQETQKGKKEAGNNNVGILHQFII